MVKFREILKANDLLKYKTVILSGKFRETLKGEMTYNKRTVILNVVKDLFANFSVGYACRLTDFSLRSRNSSSLRSE
jgi:hypothetical protein